MPLKEIRFKINIIWKQNSLQKNFKQIYVNVREREREGE